METIKYLIMLHIHCYSKETKNAVLKKTEPLLFLRSVYRNEKSIHLLFLKCHPTNIDIDNCNLLLLFILFGNASFNPHHCGREAAGHLISLHW